MASRHLSRSIAMQSLYEWDFNGKKSDLEKIAERIINEFGPGLEDTSLVWQIISGVLKHVNRIDDIIVKAAPEWPIDQITIVDRNVLRIGLFELLYSNKEEVPPKVAINEAIELAKSFGGESSGKFINGVLGTIFKEMPKEEKESKEPDEFLAGGIVYRKKDGKYEIALIKDIFGYWTFPKGHMEEGEDEKQTVLREIKEEIGLEKVNIIKNLGARIYNAKDIEKGTGHIRRKVTDFLLKTTDENEELRCEDSAGIKEAKWFSLDEIDGLKQYPEPKKVIKEVIEKLKDEKF